MAGSSNLKRKSERLSTATTRKKAKQIEAAPKSAGRDVQIVGPLRGPDQEPDRGIDAISGANGVALYGDMYEYQLIDVEKEIRLLRVQKVKNKTTLSLETFDVDLAPGYSALSYTSGDSEMTQVVHLDGKTHLITHTLMRALRDVLQPSDKERYFWVDQICLDQRDLRERNHYVTRIKNVYANAVTVVAWIGSKDANVEPAIQYIDALLDLGAGKQVKWYHDHRILAFCHFMNRPWFSTRWAIQEVAYAQEVLILYGSREIRFGDFQAAVEILEDNLEAIQGSFIKSPVQDIYQTAFANLRRSGGMEFIFALKNIWLNTNDDGIYSDPTASLAFILTYLTHFQSNNPKDFIYAIQNLATLDTHASNIPTLKADYSQSVLDIYTDTVMYCIRTSQSLEITLRPWAPFRRTRLNRNKLDPTLTSNVPSWIPSLSGLPYGDPKLNLGVRQNADSFLGPLGHPIFDSCGCKPANVTFEIGDITRKPTGSLFAQGIPLGVIERISPKMSEGTVSEESLELLGSIELNVDSARMSFDETTWEILCGGIGVENFRNSIEYKQAFTNLTEKKRSINTGELLRERFPVLKNFEKDFLTNVQSICWNRKTFRGYATFDHRDLLGLAPTDAKIGDTLAILYGCSVPVVMRPHRKEPCGTQWELIGEAYVHHYMEGEVFESMEPSDLRAAETMFEIR